MQTITPQETQQASAFLQRMLPLLLQGFTLQEAGQAVIDRDKELFKTTFAQNEEGEAIRKGLMKEVYETVKGESK